MSGEALYILSAGSNDLWSPSTDATKYGDDLYEAPEFTQPDRSGDAASVGANQTETVGAAMQIAVGAADAVPADSDHRSEIDIASFNIYRPNVTTDAMDDFML